MRGIERKRYFLAWCTGPMNVIVLWIWNFINVSVLWIWKLYLHWCYLSMTFILTNNFMWTMNASFKWIMFEHLVLLIFRKISICIAIVDNVYYYVCWLSILQYYVLIIVRSTSWFTNVRFLHDVILIFLPFTIALVCFRMIYRYHMI